MQRWICEGCGYVYDAKTGDPERGVRPGVPLEDLPEDWTCPVCRLGPESFSKEDEE
jgi:rubredoxin